MAQAIQISTDAAEKAAMDKRAKKVLARALPKAHDLARHPWGISAPRTEFTSRC